ncbi:MAG: hypothetical protein JWQ23_3653 [Herminiimonas sp.]|nr:hypothetical protein [Herminiimonas sp.]
MMDLHRYNQVLEEMCDHVKLGDRTQFLENGLLTIGGTDMFLLYDEAFDPEFLQLRIDFGPVPDCNREHLWRSLLNCNFVWGQGGYLVFSVIPENEHVVLTLKHTLNDEVSGAELANWLAFASGEAKAQWMHILRANEATRYRSLSATVHS